MHRTNSHRAMIAPLSRDGAYPSRIIAWDCEADGVVGDAGLQQLRLGVAVLFAPREDGECEILRETVFYTGAEFVEFLIGSVTPETKTYIVCHNANYDVQLLALPSMLEERGVVWTTYIGDGHPYIAIGRVGECQLVIFDSFNIFPMSLAKVGETFGMVKGDLREAQASHDELLRYCRRDTLILAQSLSRWVGLLRQYRGGGFALTIAGQALRSYRRHFAPSGVPICIDEEANDLARRGYYGGRTECFFLGRVPSQQVHVLDVRSMYPYVMMNNTYPTAIRRYIINGEVDELREKLETDYIIADVTVTTDTPLVPYRNRDKLIYPVGTFRTVLHSPEIEILAKHGRINVVHAMACYQRMDIFSEYVRHWYGMKERSEEDNNPGLRLISKLMLNSLYGKFGQYHVSDEIVDDAQGEIGELPLYGRITILSGKLGRVTVTRRGDGYHISRREGRTPHTSWEIAGAVTSYARAYLSSLIVTAGREHVYYCDTDSLFVDDLGVERLSGYIRPSGIGTLELQGTYTDVVIRAPKDYTLGGRVKIKGVPQSARQIRDGVYEYLQFRGLRRWYRDGAQPGVLVSRVTKTLHRKYDKGTLLPTGVVSPIIFAQDGPSPV